MSAAATDLIAETGLPGEIGIVVIGATARHEIASGALAMNLLTQPIRERRNNHGDVPPRRRRAPAILPPPQKLPVLEPELAEDRLQGRKAVAAVCLGARENRAKPHHRSLSKKT